MTTATAPRPTFTPPPAEDPRPWIPNPPKPSAEDLPRRIPGASKPPKPSGVVSPAAFIAARPNIADWSTVEHEIYERLVEAAAAILTEPLSPVGVTALARAEARIAATAVVRTPGRVAEVVSLLHRRHLPPSRRWRVERRLEGVVAERAALGVAS